jgi:hypothetical protein
MTMDIVKKILLIAFTVFTVQLAVISTIRFLRADEKPREVGSLDIDGTKINAFKVGDCQIFATKWKNVENPNIFFSCGALK